MRQNLTVCPLLVNFPEIRRTRYILTSFNLWDHRGCFIDVTVTGKKRRMVSSMISWLCLLGI